MELGGDGAAVQGLDYAYTLQGWLKGVNSASGASYYDMGLDSATVAKDAYGYSLGYYTGDYTPIGGTAYKAFSLQYSQTMGDITGQSLYNGNISNTTYAINQLGTPVGYTYAYDQLNRIKRMRQYAGIHGTSWSRANITQNYQENVTYDGNGNILTYGRNGLSPTTAQTIDSLAYHYTLANGKITTNKLNYITDAVSSSGYNLDLRNQTSLTNYGYDALGNVIKDVYAGITNIGWTVYNKPDTIYKSSGNIIYTYNTANQRVSKTIGGVTTWYVRDAQGNLLGLYDNVHGNNNWREQHLYGSSRLGMWMPNMNMATNNSVAIWDSVGKKQYEVDNHLGNVLTTVTDKRLQHSTSGTAIDYYLADVASAQDYYPGGMLMPSRIYTYGSDSSYRYGFNGRENDNTVKGLGNQIDYGARIYDPRIVRFDSVDPLISKYAWYSPYQFAGDNPIVFVDLDGAEPQIPLISKYRYGGNVALNAITVVDNTAINLVNGGIGLVNAFVSVGHEVVFNTKNVPRQFKDASIDLYHSTTKYAADSYKNLFKTPIKRQLKEAAKALTNPETYEQSLTFGTSLYAGRAAPSLGLTEETASYSVFEQPKFNRGLDIEDALGGNLPKNFPVIDRFANGVATSIKSVDLASTTYQKASNLISKLRSYVNSVANFRGATFSGRRIGLSEIVSRELNIAIQEGKATAEQTKALQDIVQYGASNGVTVTITKIK